MKKNQTNVSGLRKALDLLGLTVTQAAIATGIPYSTVWAHYSGTRVPKAEYAIKYDKFLGIPKHIIRPDIWQEPCNETMNVGKNNEN